MTRSTKAWGAFLATRLAGLAADTAVLAVAYLSAFALRFDFAPPPWGWHGAARSFILVCVVHLASLVLCGCYRLAWRRTSYADVPRYVGATALALAVLLVLRLILSSSAFVTVRPPFSVMALCFFFSTAGFIGVRALWRAFWSSRRSDTALLARDVRTFDNAPVARFLAGRVVMVTGAGGSIGSEIVRQVAMAGAAKILLVERCENALYEIDREIRRRFPSVPLAALMVDCGDRERMAAVFARERPSVVLHAAAYKHVPMVELNPDEGRRNNTGSTRTLAELAAANGVARFVLISTDKAVNPVSVMGKTKRDAEKIVMTTPGGTKFCAVRFGNVFGSSGSVVPLFREQIARKGPVTVTHPDMRRYFMTIREAVSLVLQAASRDERAIYTLDMGEPVRIVDLAEGMIRQAGYRPYVDVPIVFTGVRPGEKLFEELDISERSAYRTDMAKIYITRDAAAAPDAL
jgi:FlaA1/EpsC-like NDP-sugar epimerase